MSQQRRVELVIEGLEVIGANVATLAAELEKCNDARAFRAAQLTYNVAREEAGKFLILVDAWRAPEASQAHTARQFSRAGDHLAKLIYAQVADYSIATKEELVRLVNLHRQRLYLDGPNDFDWIFRNDLLSEREGALYVDLVNAEGELQWWSPRDYVTSSPVPTSLQLVSYLMSSGLVSAQGLRALQEAWEGFDPHVDSHCSDWAQRNVAALSQFPDANVQNDRPTAEGSIMADRWPMPMVEIEVEMDKATTQELQQKRDAAYSRWIEREFGPFE